MRQPIQVSVYAVRTANNDWEYLLLRRATSRGGFWQGVTGSVEENENLAKAALRELAEETGLIPSGLEQLDYSFSFPLRDEWRDMYAAGVKEVVEYVFVAFVDGQKEPAISREHDRWQWCSLGQALELLTYPGNTEAVKCCNSFLREYKR